MLKLVVPDQELYDDGKSEFIIVKGQTIQVEHSLVSISKWESKWNKPFLTKEEKTIEETIDYVRCMCLTQNVSDEVFNNLTNENINQISRYIAAPMTATKLNDSAKGSPGEIKTSEVLYSLMISYNIPFECQKWHLNRLLTLIRVCSYHNSPPKKMSKSEIMNRNRELNNQRRQKYNTNG